MGKIHKFGFRWLEDFSSAKKKEFTIRKREGINKIDRGGVSEALSSVDELKDQLDDQEDKIEELEDDLDDCKGDSGIDKTNLQAAKDNAKKIKEDILKELDDIRTNIVLKIEGQKFLNLKNNKQEIEDLKNQLKNKLNIIERHTGELD